MLRSSWLLNNPTGSIGARAGDVIRSESGSKRGEDPPVRFTALAVQERQLLQPLGEDRLLVLPSQRVLIEPDEVVNVHRAQPSRS